MSVIRLESLRKSYGGDFTLGPVSLQVEPGYVVAVVGPNGSGKSTLFRLLLGLARADSGEVRVFGRDPAGDEVGIRERIGYVPENAVGHDEMSAAELGDFIGRLYPNWSERSYRELLRRAGVDPKKRFDKLSKGMRRRLLFALALATGSELLLLDEPTDGVDPFARREMLDEISAYMDGDGPDEVRTVLFATHIIEEVRRVADYVVFLSDGDFLGLYEKDALLDGWRNLWVVPEPDGDLPGIVEVEPGSPTRLVTDSPGETGEALAERGVRIVRSAPLDLEEILGHLMRRGKAAEERSMR
ncbi:ABC-type multidrug transport system ATPase component [Rubrobacter radiotolerans]|uniref:ABC transporter ATP-binding protein n=1 Tax=Rubrobacter radiotolerans TaxID=42256 RepID=A0A023X673_RUBRA|nr:ABC transporter ATP-binding protein [Rubrobacter radiotolerans]AHY47539.1 ABC-type multidrug transport system ATPase component [Rubrobacter radiotolerans]MDX5894942.1 ABC transporter ATP-binding protein [Rubrobacter radiotolerans]SMC07124.1 ABC-2 type transport system ATP-binding protein [Rubrobacter radiotolerans DSM 5868]